MSAVFSSAAFTPTTLPKVLPIFPLSGVVLMPRARLPLNIFEPRYLTMIEDVLGQGRLIGMTQPTIPDVVNNPMPPIYRIGCAGRISSFTETEDGRFLLGLTGICRFTITEELTEGLPYRRARVDWRTYMTDIADPEEVDVDRNRLTKLLHNYFKMQGIAADWNAVQNTPNDTLISSLVMICPLAPNERQALLEAPNLSSRAELLMALLEMAAMPQQSEAEASIKH
jgi:Lon protease-like protein